MKRLFALIMALAMLTALFAAAATAETVTSKVAIDETEEADETQAEADAVGLYFALFDPSLSINDEVVLDLDGMEAELDLVLSDEGFLTLALFSYVGENYDECLLATAAQLDENGLTLWADGLSSSYGITAEWFESESGVDLSVFADTQFYTLFESLSALSSYSAQFSVTRLGLLETLVILYGTATDGTDYALTLTREDGAAIMDSIGEMAEDMDEEIDASIFEDAEIEFDGTAEISDDGLTISLAGTLYDTAADESYPFTLEYADNGVDADGELIVTGGDESTTFRLYHTSEGGASITRLTIWADDDTEDSIVFTYSVHPDDDSSEVDYWFEVYVDGEEEMVLRFSNDIYDSDTADVSFRFELEVEGEELLDILYYGLNYEDDAESWQVGNLTANLYDEGDEITLTTSLILGKDSESSADWHLDSDSFVDINQLSDEEYETLISELSVLVDSALTLLEETQPDLYALLNE